MRQKWACYGAYVSLGADEVFWHNRVILYFKCQKAFPFLEQARDEVDIMQRAKFICGAVS